MDAAVSAAPADLAGNEDLARKALAKKSESDKQVASMQQAVESARQTSEKLKAQVAVCNSELGLKLFPDEEEHIVSYLNDTYYKFR